MIQMCHYKVIYTLLFPLSIFLPSSSFADTVADPDQPVRLFAETHVVPVSLTSIDVRAAELSKDIKTTKTFASQQRPPTGCGNLNIRPCNLWEAFPSCKDHLIEDFIKGLCVAPQGKSKGVLIENLRANNVTKQLIQGVVNLARALASKDFFPPPGNESHGLMTSGEFSVYAFNGDINTIEQYFKSDDSVWKIYNALKAAGRQLKFSTLSIGTSVSASLGIGGTVIEGIAMPLNAGQKPYSFRTYSLDAGWISGAHYGIAIGLSKNPPNKYCGESKGVGFWLSPPGAPVNVGVTAGFGSLDQAHFLIDFREIQDINANVTVGLDLVEAATVETLATANAAFSTALTTVESVDGDNGQCQCGNRGQRPCTLIEQFPSCNGNNVENFLQHLCTAP